MIKESDKTIAGADTGKLAAVVLAAGFSSRMGALKPLLPLGPSLAIERVITSLRAAGVAQVIAVTGHEAEAVAPVLQRLGVERSHNAGYECGMFSSVQTGVAAVGDDIEAFFVLPVDCPLVTSRALRLVAECYRRSGKGIIYPACFGRRGHPPLLSASYVQPLLEAENTSDLRGFLAAHAAHAIEVDVRDLTVLMDMDTRADYRALRRFAEALDRAVALEGAAAPGAPTATAAAPTAAPSAATPGVAASRPEPSLTVEEALYLLAAAGTPTNVVRHCRAVAAVGEALAQPLKRHVSTLDVALVRAGCLLHDVARLQPHHASLAREVLANLGLPRLGAVVGEHMVLDPALPAASGVTEAELVYLADKLVGEDELIGLEERQARTFRKMRPGPETAASIKARIGHARLISHKVEALLGRPVMEALAGTPVPDDPPRELRVYLVRHAEPEGPSGRRYTGRSDPPLGPRGEQQARRLAGRLMAMTGGACFDAIFASDLQRSARTAEIVAEECGTGVERLLWLREVDVGLWEGLTWEEARLSYPRESAEREQDVVGVPFPGGESFADVRARVVPYFERLVGESLAAGRRRVLMVGHKGVNRVLLANFRGFPLEDVFSIEQDFCAVTVLSYCTAPA